MELFNSIWRRFKLRKVLKLIDLWNGNKKSGDFFEDEVLLCGEGEY
jgi:hypothetical protein